MKKIQFLIYIMIILLFSCKEEYNIEEKKNIIYSSLPSIGNNSTLNISKKNSRLIIDITPEFHMFENKKHSNAMASYLIKKLYENSKPINTTINLYKENRQRVTLNFEINEIASITHLYKDSVLLSMIKYVVANFNPYDAGTLDGYVKRVIDDFPTLINNSGQHDFYTVFEMFYNECIEKKRKAEGQNIFVILYSMDKELDILKSKSRYSKLIKGIWNIARDDSIEEAERSIFIGT